MRNTRLPFIAAALLSAACLIAATGCASHPERPQYAVICKGDTSFEFGKPAAYDPAIGGYWLQGRDGTVHLNPLPDAPPGDLVLNIRTASNTSTPSSIVMLRVSTPEHIITANPRESSIYVLPNNAPANAESRANILRNADYVRFERDGNRAVVVLSREFLQRYAPNGASVKWFNQ